MEWPGMVLNMNLHLSEETREALAKEPMGWLVWLILISFLGLAVLLGR